MKKIALATALTVSAACIWNDEARASGPGTPPITFITEAAPVLAPFQHVRFCLRHPTECKPSASARERVKLDDIAIELLKRTNKEVNASIAPTVKSYGAKLDDGWTVGPASGDCNDYAVTKRHQLLDRGLPSNALRLSVVRTPSGIGHLVLVVITTKGDLVLDNLTGEIRDWHQTKYEWLKIQSSDDPKLWFDIKPSFESPVLAVTRHRVSVANR